MCLDPAVIEYDDLLSQHLAIPDRVVRSLTDCAEQCGLAFTQPQSSALLARCRRRLRSWPINTLHIGFQDPSRSSVLCLCPGVETMLTYRK